MTEDADNRSKWRKTHVTDVSLGEYCILKDTFLVPFKEAHVTYDYSKSTVKAMLHPDVVLVCTVEINFWYRGRGAGIAIHTTVPNVTTQPTRADELVTSWM